MTVRDLYTYTDDEQKFILIAESNMDDYFFRGKLKDCPSDIIDEVVYQIKAIDFNEIAVIVCI